MSEAIENIEAVQDPSTEHGTLVAKPVQGKVSIGELYHRFNRVAGAKLGFVSKYGRLGSMDEEEETDPHAFINHPCFEKCVYMDKAELHAGAQASYKDDDDYKNQLVISKGHAEFLKEAHQREEFYDDKLDELQRATKKYLLLRSNNKKTMDTQIACRHQCQAIITEYDQNYEACAYLLQPADKKKYAGDYSLENILKDEDLDTPEKRAAIHVEEFQAKKIPRLDNMGHGRNNHCKNLKYGLRKHRLKGEDNPTLKKRYFKEWFGIDHDLDLEIIRAKKAKRKRQDNDLELLKEQEAEAREKLAELQHKRRKTETEQKARAIYEKTIQEEGGSEENPPNEQVQSRDEDVVEGEVDGDPGLE